MSRDPLRDPVLDWDALEFEGNGHGLTCRCIDCDPDFHFAGDWDRAFDAYSDASLDLL